MAEFISGEVEKTNSEKFSKFFQRLRSKKNITYITTFLLLIALPLTIYVSLQQQVFKQHAAEKSLIITGTVIDASTSKPLDGVTVWDGLSATTQQDDNKNITDLNGNFSLKINIPGGLTDVNKNPTGIYYITIFKNGYQGQEIKQIMTDHDIFIDTPIALVPSQAITANFIKVKGTQMWDGNHPFYFVGAQDNSYSEEWIQRHRAGWTSYGGNATYYSQELSIDEQRMQDALESGVTVDRHGMNSPEKAGFTYSPDSEAPIMIDHTFQQRGLMTIDRIVYLAHKYNRRVILTFMNNPDTEKMEDIAGAPRGSWGTDPKASQFFQEYVTGVLNHVNMLTGIALKDDPTILAWDLCNEAYFSGGSEFQWHEKQAAFIKSLTKQLVTTGKDGDYARYLHSPSLDFVTWHVYAMDACNKDETCTHVIKKIRTVFKEDPITGEKGCEEKEIIEERKIPGTSVTNTGWGIYYDYPYDGATYPHVDGPVSQNFFKWTVQQAINDAQVANKPLVIEETGIMRYTELENPSEFIFRERTIHEQCEKDRTDNFKEIDYTYYPFDTIKVQDRNNQTGALSIIDLGKGSEAFRASWIKTIFDASHQPPTMQSGGNTIDKPGFLEWGKWKRSDQAPDFAGPPLTVPSSFTEKNFLIDTQTPFAGTTSAKIVAAGGSNCIFQDIKVPVKHTRYWWSLAGRTDIPGGSIAQLWGWDGSKWNLMTTGNSSLRPFNSNVWVQQEGFVDSGIYKYIRAALSTDWKTEGNAWFDQVQLIPYISTIRPAIVPQQIPIAGVIWWSFNYYDQYAVKDIYSLNKSMPLYTTELYKAFQWTQLYNPIPNPTLTLTPTPTSILTPTTIPTMTIFPTPTITVSPTSELTPTPSVSPVPTIRPAM